MKKTLTIVLIALVVYAVIFYAIRIVKKKKYLSYLHSLGFGIVDRMKYKEIEDSYNYLYNYARKYSGNAPSIVKNTNPSLYNRLVAISSKYGLFNLNTSLSETNIPNIEVSEHTAPIIPTTPNPATMPHNITPPTLNIV